MFCDNFEASVFILKSYNSFRVCIYEQTKLYSIYPHVNGMEKLNETTRV
jgi:ASC-1-like (ASCH) protein